jgi:hypothetical protein
LPLICAAPWPAYGLITVATPGSSAISFRVRVMVCSTSAARTVPDAVCQTTVSLSPPSSGKPSRSSWVACPDSVPGAS